MDGTGSLLRREQISSASSINRSTNHLPPQTYLTLNHETADTSVCNNSFEVFEQPLDDCWMGDI